MGDIKVGLAYNAFFGAFKQYYPNLKLIRTPEETGEFDLIIFSGGSDVDPYFYGEKNHYSGGVDKTRDHFEFSVFDLALHLNKQVLGVCRGHQLINIAMGGSLYQDIYLCTGINHRHNGPLSTDSSSVIGKFFSGGLVNSMHHQAIKRAGNIYITSTMGSIAESLESENKRIITTQFHPEFMGEETIPFFKYMLELAENKPAPIEKKDTKKKKNKYSSYLVSFSPTEISTDSTSATLSSLGSMDISEPPTFLSDNSISYEEAMRSLGEHFPSDQGENR